MPVERVELMEREEIDVLLHELLRHEMPRDVEVHAAPLEARAVDDRHRGHLPRDATYGGIAKNGGRKQLSNRLHGIESTRRSRRRDRDDAGPHVELVAFVAERGVAL